MPAVQSKLRDGQPGVHEVNTILDVGTDADGTVVYLVNWVGYPILILITDYWLLITHYSLLITHYSLLITHY
jgi:hypothetical protein